MDDVRWQAMKLVFFGMPMFACILGLIPTRKWFFISTGVFLLCFVGFLYFATQELAKETDAGPEGFGMAMYFGLMGFVAIVSIGLRFLCVAINLTKKLNMKNYLINFFWG
jgi:hypothetical protein